MKKRQIFSAIAVVVISFLFFFYIRKSFPDIKEALKISPKYIFCIVALNVLNKVCIGLKTRRIFRVFNIKLTFTEWFGSTAINNFYNYLAPKSGTVMAGVYFKNRHGFDYHKYASILIATLIVTVMTSGLLGIGVSSYTFYAGFVASPVFIFLFLAMTVLPFILISMPEVRLPKRKILNKINDALDGWHLLRKDKRLLFTLSLLDLCVIIFMSLRYYILFRMLSANASFLNCVILAPFNIIVHVSTIIPGSFGVKEAAIGLLAKLSNIGFNNGVYATLCDRALSMAVTFIIGPIASLVLFKHLFVFNKQEEK